MALIAQTEYEQLLINGNEDNTGKDHRPVVKLFIPASGGMVWLLTEIDRFNPRYAYGLVDLGHGCPEYGRIDLKDIADMRGRFDLPVQRDDYFIACYPISVYAKAAAALEYVTEDNTILSRFVQNKAAALKPLPF